MKKFESYFASLPPSEQVMKPALQTYFEAGQRTNPFPVDNVNLAHFEKSLTAAYNAGKEAGPDVARETFTPEIHNAEKLFNDLEQQKEKYELLEASFKTSQGHVKELSKYKKEAEQIILEMTDQITELKKENSALKATNKTVKDKLAENKAPKPPKKK